MPKSSEHLKIGFVFDDTLDSSDGVAQYVKTLGKWLSDQGHEVRYLVGQTKMKSWAGGKVYSLSKNQRVIFNGNRLSIPLPANKSRIAKVLTAEQFDILHVQVPYSPFMAQRVISAASGNTAIIGTFHIMPHGFLSRWGSLGLRLVQFKSFNRFDQMLSVSSAALKFAKSTYGLDSSVMPNVVDLGRFKKAKSKPVANSVTFLGRLVKRKGCRYLLSAFIELKKELPSATLTIAGDGPDRLRLKSIVAKAGLQDSVTFLGFIDEKNKPDLLASAAVACFPSTGGESFGIVLIEAMAAGSGVVIGGNNPGYTTVLGDQPQTLFDPKDTAALANKLKELLTTRLTAEGLHIAQQQEVNQYDINVVGPMIVDAYKQRIDSRAKKSNNIKV